MTVIDLIIKLQQMPATKEVMIDVTGKDMMMFKFTGCNAVQEVTTSMDEDIVLLSQYDYNEDVDTIEPPY